MQSTRFKDKICIVTGAGSGIGRATALCLASEGERVTILDIQAEQGGSDEVRFITALRSSWMAVG